jgi:hypothetical protein
LAINFFMELKVARDGRPEKEKGNDNSDESEGRPLVARGEQEPNGVGVQFIM